MAEVDILTATRDIENFLEDADLERLEDIAEQFNVFEVLGAVHQEVRHSNFLGWLLNPHGNHGLADYFLKRFLWKTAALASNGEGQRITPIEVDLLDLSQVEVRREWRSIDILILSETHGFVCAIENKIYTSEHSDQLRRYREICESAFPGYSLHLLFLSPAGQEPSDYTWTAVSYDLVLEQAERVLKVKETSLSEAISVLLQHYCQMLRRHIVGDSDIEQLSRRIYAKHQRALDLLFEHRPDRQSAVRDLLAALIEGDAELELDAAQKSYLQFTPRAWDSPHLEKGERKRILTFQFENRPDRLRLLLYIAPGDQPTREAIFKSLTSRNAALFSSSNRLYSKWTTIWKVDFLTSIDFESHDMEWIESRLQEKFSDFKSNYLPTMNEAVRQIEF